MTSICKMLTSLLIRKVLTMPESNYSILFHLTQEFKSTTVFKPALKDHLLSHSYPVKGHTSIENSYILYIVM